MDPATSDSTSKLQNRLSLNAYFMLIAKAAAMRSTCPRRSVGAVLTLNNKVQGTGYNGAIVGGRHCLDQGCVMFKANDREEPHCINTVHAEINAILQGHSGDTLYCTDMPCLACLKACINTGIQRVVYWRTYPDDARDYWYHEVNPAIQLHAIELCIGSVEYTYLENTL